MPDSGDDDGFVDTYELLSGMKQESINSGSIAEKVDHGTRGGSPADSARSIEGSSQGEHSAFLHLARTLTHPIPDPIILSDDESVGAESETDYSDLDVDSRAKSDSGPPHPEGEPADGDRWRHVRAAG